MDREQEKERAKEKSETSSTDTDIKTVVKHWLTWPMIPARWKSQVKVCNPQWISALISIEITSFPINLGFQGFWTTG